MIKKVAFKNFRVLADVEVELAPFTVLVGPNASGKSTILDGINRISKCRVNNNHFSISPLIAGADWSRQENDVYFPPESIITKDRGNTISFSLMSTHAQKAFDCLFEVDENQTWKVWLNYSLNERRDFTYRAGMGLFSPNKQWLPQSIHLRLNGNQLSNPSYSHAEPPQVPQIMSDGRGLAALLAEIKLRDDARFLKIQHLLQQVVQNVTRVFLASAKVPKRDWIDYQPVITDDLNTTVNGSKLMLDFIGAKDISAEAVSEGTLFALAILTIATDSENDWLILLDDLERGLHPLAVGDLVKVLKNLVKENPRLQIVATTHSPYLLNFVEPEEVRVVTLDSQGHTLVAKLTEHPEYDQWKDSMMPGEFWGWAGEDWVWEQREKKGEPAKTS